MGRSATGNGWHSLRHSFASWAAMAGVDIRVLKEWMGHRTIQTTMRCAAVKPTTHVRSEQLLQSEKKFNQAVFLFAKI